MMSIKKNIPNIITCGNLFCGCIAIVAAFKGNLVWSSYLVGIAAVLDFLDGFLARLLKVHSEIGKQLDSLADMVTFGLVPGIVMYLLLTKATATCSFSEMDNSICSLVNGVQCYMPFIAFLITIFSAIRLAKFNTDSRQADLFIGLPTPANAILICSLPLITFFQPQIGSINTLLIIDNIWVLLSITIVMSFLMVAKIPLFALKFKSFDWSSNKKRYSFLIISLLSLLLFHFFAIPFIIFLYIILSLIIK